MSSLQRRFGILLPQRYNDGSPVPEELFNIRRSMLQAAEVSG